MKKGWWVLKVVVCVVLAIGLFGWVTMQLWNWLIPVLFSGPVVTYWQALGILVLSKILFWGGKGGGHNGGGRWRNHYWKQKWTGMSPEERELFKKKMKDKWCHREESSATSESGSSNV